MFFSSYRKLSLSNAETLPSCSRFSYRRVTHISAFKLLQYLCSILKNSVVVLFNFLSSCHKSLLLKLSLRFEIFFYRFMVFDMEMAVITPIHTGYPETTNATENNKRN